MAWLELSIEVEQRSLSRVESALEDLEAASITLLDAEDHPILEPGPGETPLWPQVTVRALFHDHVDRIGLFDALQIMVPWLTPEKITARGVADEDWTRVWMDTFQPMQFGRRTWIYPSTTEPPADTDAAIVRLDPGLAFGTGTHPTTALCLSWLDGLDLVGKTVLDFGCGSGILAIAALKLGAARAIGIDNDPQAIIASRDNADRNGVTGQLDLYLPDAVPADLTADVVVANILAGALIALQPTITGHCRSGSPLALSGILGDQADEVAAAYRQDFPELTVTPQEDWVRIAGVRR
ncbi:MAG: 50S ribosomal protein L11 methyltransferase [Rhodanobacteraceae bacterium]|nr:50S ribosomal protein L11 methyltransferase [Rhodanobacteraceae bacterium]